MSDEKEKVAATSENIFANLESDEQLEITIRKATNEVILRNPKDGKIVTLKANFESGDDANEPPIGLKDETALTPEEFEDGLRGLDELGLTFTVDLYPQISAKEENSGLIDAEALTRLQQKYPTLPREVGFVAHNTMTGRDYAVDLLGGEEVYKKKSEIVKNLLLTDSYREEFFFKYALKVPSYEGLDWEIILKTHEKGVDDVVGMPYALLMLNFRNPTHSAAGRQEIEQFVSVALNRARLDKLLGELTRVRSSLDKSFEIRQSWKSTESSKEVKV